ncbi:MAG: ribbon-helix-helix domain-containing protein [Candidatus Woesearchaeota archaeon]
MEVVTVKFREDVLKKIDSSIKDHNFNSRTEFIREAVRDKLTNLSRDELIKEFMKFRGKARVKVSDKRLREIRDEASKELMEDLDKRFR